MADPKLQAIIDIFHKHGCDIYESDIWKVQGTPVVNHKALERLAAKIKLVWQLPKVIRAERTEAVILVAANLDGNEKSLQWSIGEALIATDATQPSNYRVSGKQAAYVYAMAEKRAKDRVILKLAGIEATSEEESEDLKRDKADRESVPASDAPAIPATVAAENAPTSPEPVAGEPSAPAAPPAPDQPDNFDVMESLLGKIDKVTAPREALELMLTQPFQSRLAVLPQGDQTVVIATGIRKMFEAATDVDVVTSITTSATVKNWLEALGPEAKEQTLQYGRDVYSALKTGREKPKAIPEAVPA